MNPNLIDRRERAMDRADRALDAAWPARKSDEYVREMQSVAGELEAIAAAMSTEGSDPAEQSRTYSNLGSVYSDLAPALGREMLREARQAYLRAEALLKDSDDELAQAKLDFNFANTLRQMDPNDAEQLQEARRRLLSAQKVFVGQAPQYNPQVDAALASVESLLAIAPVVRAIEQNDAEAQTLQEELKKGGNAADVAAKARELLTRGGGAAGLIGRVQGLIAQLPPELQQSEGFARIRQKMDALTAHAPGGAAAGTQEAQMVEMLRGLLAAERQQGKVTSDRAAVMEGLLKKIDAIVSEDRDDAQGLMEKLRGLREAAGARFEILHYLSHGIPRPPEGSRAAQLVESCWVLRRFLIEEMNRPNKGAAESKRLLELNGEAARVDQRIYEAGANDERAKQVDKDEFRPLALTVRDFSTRVCPMLAKPIWSSARSSVDTNAVVYSGPSDHLRLVASACQQLGLDVLQSPRGENVARARWRQLQSALTTVFDLGFEDGPARAAVAYELGIALTLGKPILVLTGAKRPLPFDVDLVPLVLSGDRDQEADLAAAIDRSIVATYDRTRSGGSRATLDHILSQYTRPYPDTYVDGTLKLLRDQQGDPDLLTLDQTIAQFVDFLKDGATTLIHPTWPPVYPAAGASRLFHVMKYHPPEWARAVTEVTRRACNAEAITYVRGDEVADPNIIRSIWEEIARATWVVADMTGFNANVALELGIAHTIGRPSLMVGQGTTVKKLFPLVAKLRHFRYDDPAELEGFLRNSLRNHGAKDR